jgi:hypothetical protein
MTDYTCPWCGKKNSDIQGLTDDREPEDGCVIICFGCEAWSILEAGSLRRATGAEVREGLSDPENVMAVGLFSRLKKEVNTP